MSRYRNDSLLPRPGTAQSGRPAAGDSATAYETTLRNGGVRNQIGSDGPDVGALESYRRWLNRMQSPDKKRSPMDPALYTWKGYRNWSDKIRRDWKKDE